MSLSAPRSSTPRAGNATKKDSEEAPTAKTVQEPYVDAKVAKHLKIYEKPEVRLVNGKKQGNIVRRKTDYYWILGFYATFFVLAQVAWPGFFHTTPNDRSNIVHEVNRAFGWEDPLGKDLWKVFVSYFVQVGLVLPLLVFVIFIFMYIVAPEKTYTPALWKQLPGVCANCFVMMPLADAIATYLGHRGWVKLFVEEPPYIPGDYVMLYHFRDMLLWVLGFELTWYAQHRAMHDSKFLWKLGHEYHHQWRRPEHMIGITNFAFDHVVEVWVTMSSSFFPMVFFPIHIWAFRIIGFLWLIIALFAHWDGFPMRFHLNHHYVVIKNYGSHLPFFDMFFGTYQPGSFFYNTDDEKYPSFKPINRKKDVEMPAKKE
jgi:sterol desaturase/sphingolipid hydroxylase (fatty acid hydroxylase superfamily)